MIPKTDDYTPVLREDEEAAQALELPEVAEPEEPGPPTTVDMSTGIVTIENDIVHPIVNITPPPAVVMQPERTHPPSTATITISLDAYETIKREREQAWLDKAKLTNELALERAKTTEQRLTECLDLIDAFKTITDHAVANMHPEFIRDIPAEALTVAAVHVDKVMGATQRDTERAGVWLERAALVQTWRDKRKARGWGEDAEPHTVTTPPTGRRKRTAEENRAIQEKRLATMAKNKRAAKRAAKAKPAKGKRGKGRR